MNFKKLYVSLLISLFVLLSVFGDGGEVFVQSNLYPNQKTEGFAQQLGLDAVPVTIPDNATSLASGNTNYPVTPGDVYTLTYREASNLVTETLSVDSLSRIQTSYSGVIDATGMTFIELKQKIESALLTLYPYSKPQLTISSCGIFSVYIYGQVKYSQDVQVWGLSKLSDLSWYATNYASTRNVEITYKDGTVKSYDLFKALMFAQSDNNPLLQSGCSVKFNNADTTVTLNGYSRKTGTFQTLENETLEDLINIYGQGLLNNADESQYTVSRFKNGQFSTKLIAKNEAKNYILQNGDNIHVQNAVQDLPFITIEGALDDASDSQGSKIFYQYFPGETAEDLIRSIKGKFTTATNTKSIFLTRADGTIISLNADEILSTNKVGSTVLQEGDVVTVPFSKQVVTVSGAVAKPGSYTYVPGKNYEYYVNMAGGYSSDARKLSISILDVDGNKVSTSSTLLADSIINIPRRNGNLYSDVILASAILALVSSCIAMYTTLNK